MKAILAIFLILTQWLQVGFAYTKEPARKLWGSYPDLHIYDEQKHCWYNDSWMMETWVRLSEHEFDVNGTHMALNLRETIPCKKRFFLQIKAVPAAILEEHNIILLSAACVSLDMAGSRRQKSYFVCSAPTWWREQIGFNTGETMAAIDAIKRAHASLHLDGIFLEEPPGFEQLQEIIQADIASGLCPTVCCVVDDQNLGSSLALLAGLRQRFGDNFQAALIGETYGLKVSPPVDRVAEGFNQDAVRWAVGMLPRANAAEAAEKQLEKDRWNKLSKGEQLAEIAIWLTENDDGLEEV